MTSPADLPPEQQALRAACFHPTEPFVEFREEEIEQSIAARFEDQARRHSHRLAVKTKEDRWSYAELNRAANRIAHAILARRGEGFEHVAMILRHGATAIAAVLGILKAGKAYVPLDASAPKARNAHILNHAEAGLLLADRHTAPLAAELAGRAMAVLDVDALDTALPDGNPGLRMSPERVSHLMYTSGSTGDPKGVLQTHRNVLYKAMGWTNVVHLCPGDRTSLMRSLSVSGSIRDLFGAILCGAAVVTFDVKTEGLVHLAAWLRAEGVTVFTPVVTLFRSLGATLTGAEDLSSVRLLKLSGEPVQKRDVDLYKRHFPDSCLMINILASAEVGSTRVYFVGKATPVEEHFLPVGYAFQGCNVLLLDAAGNRLGCNEVGEIAVQSRFLSPGYWRMPELTASVFSADPTGGGERIYRTGDLGCMLPDGCLLHRGRKDSHVKIRGYSVELAEIEAALVSLDAVRETVVTTRDDAQGNQALVAYVIPRDPAAASASALRAALSAQLPDYMIPAAFVFMAEFPLLGPGKVNLRALPAPGSARPELDVPFALPRTAVEEALVRIWSDVLKLDRIGIHDRFLDLGGNSLMATRVIAQTRDAFDAEVTLQRFFAAPTVAGMAAVVEAQRR